MDYLFEYLVFLAQAITVVVAVVAVLAAASSLGARRLQSDAGHLEVHKLNDSLDSLRNGIRRALLPPGEFRKLARKEARDKKKALKGALREPPAAPPSTPPANSTPASGPAAAEAAAKDAGGEVVPTTAQEGEKAPPARVFVVDFKGDLQAHAVKHLRTELTAILTMAQPTDEVVVRLESHGGAVHGYGLAASQLDRVQQHGVRLVVAVDKVAASGGYMMAAVADRVLAAPFAIIGSIGVIAQVPNVHRLLKKHDVDVEVITAGKYKRTLTVLGENTEEGRQKFIEEIEDVHELFKQYVAARRPALDLETVATGEAWYGQRALEKRLVDEISTSDEYLTRAGAVSDVYHVRWVEHKKPIERILGHIESSLSSVVERFTRNF